jgi:2,4-dienoyl-CoA reductase-like NADH-dependent reductase (Old Yellow Enzyme family)
VNFVLTPGAALLQPITIGGFEARNRIFMAPMTRSRSESDGTPSQLQVEYYTQRAGAGLIIGESRSGSELNEPISATLYSIGLQGYTDYPTLSRGPGDEAVA